MHVTLKLKYSTVIKDNGGNVITDKRWQGTFEGNSSASRISGVNQVYDFNGSIDGFANATYFSKSCAGGCSEHTDTVSAVSGSNFSITVGPSTFNAQTGELFAPFFGFSADTSNGVTAMAGTTRVDFDADIPAKLDSRCTQDANVTSSGVIALDGDVYTGYVIRQTYSCTAGTTVFTYENSAQISAR